jgi:zinc/manganese transport system substrate-binding protein
MRLRHLWFVFFALLFVAVVALGSYTYVPTSAERPASERPKVIATIFPVAILAMNVAGSDADVELLVPSGSGPHEYAPTPGDIRRIAEADVIVMNGLGIDAWLADLIAESGTKALVIDASAGVETREAEEGGTDPHIWLDPVRAAQMTAMIAEGFARADPVNTAVYRANAAAYRARLTELDQDFARSLGAAPRKDFISFHESWGYLAERYGLEQRAVIEEFPGKEPTARELANLVTLIRQTGVRALFSEPQFSPKVVATLAEETGLRISELDTLETGELAPETYERVMRQNLQTFVEAFAE